MSRWCGAVDNCHLKRLPYSCVWSSEECCTPIMLERGTLLPGMRRLGWPSGMLLLCTRFSFQMHHALSDWWSSLAECDIHGYQGREKGEGVHKKAQIKGYCLCSISPVLCWNGRNVASRPTGLQSLQPLMNFKRPFSFKAGCWLTACRLAKHSRREERRREEHRRVGGRREGGAGKVSWHPGRVGYWMSLTVRDNRALCMGSHCRNILDPATRVERE